MAEILRTFNNPPPHTRVYTHTHTSKNAIVKCKYIGIVHCIMPLFPVGSAEFPDISIQTYYPCLKSYSFIFTFSFGNLHRQKQLKTSWSKKMVIKRERQLVMAFEQELKDAKATEEEVIFLHQTKFRLRM